MTKLKVLRSAPSRMRGLIGRPRSDDVVVLAPCRDIHTYLMSYPIDVAFLDKQARVIKAYRGVEPRSRIRCMSAYAVVERACDARKQWFMPHSFAGRRIYQVLQERNKR